MPSDLVRNTKVIDIYRSLKEYNVNITVYDPWANPDIAKREYGIEITDRLPENKFNAVVLAVAHNQFKELNILDLCTQRHTIFDVKGFLDKSLIDGRL